MAFIEPASVRHRNPGAVGLGGPNSSSRKFGANEETTLNDGQGNTIATFSTKVQGAAAQFDLLATRYTGLTVRNALKRWSGGNHVDTYCKVVCKRTGLSESDTLTASYIRTPSTGIKFAKAMAYHEAGKEYPMTAKEWKQAHALAFPAPASARKGLRIPFRIPAADGPSNELGDRIADMALTYVGKGEKPGPGNYQFMDDFYDTLGLPRMEDNKTAWCKLTVSAIRKKCGAEVENADNDDILLARNLVKKGPSAAPGILIDKNQPELIKRGDAPVWPRGKSSWEGHTGTVVTVDVEGQRIECVEGNVSDSTVRKWYTFAQIKSKALGINRPIPDKRQPNGTVRYRDVVKDSPSITMQIYAWFAALVGGVASYWNEIAGGISGAVHALPLVAEQTSTTVGSAQQIVQTAGLSWPAKLAFLMTAILAATALYRVLRERSQNGGKRVPR